MLKRRGPIAGLLVVGLLEIKSNIDREKGVWSKRMLNNSKIKYPVNTVELLKACRDDGDS